MLDTSTSWLVVRHASQAEHYILSWCVTTHMGCEGLLVARASLPKQAYTWQESGYQAAKFASTIARQKLPIHQVVLQGALKHLHPQHGKHAVFFNVKPMKPSTSQMNDLDQPRTSTPSL